MNKAKNNANHLFDAHLLDDFYEIKKFVWKMGVNGTIMVIVSCFLPWFATYNKAYNSLETPFFLGILIVALVFCLTGLGLSSEYGDIKPSFMALGFGLFSALIYCCLLALSGINAFDADDRLNLHTFGFGILLGLAGLSLVMLAAIANLGIDLVVMVLKSMRATFDK